MKIFVSFLVLLLGLTSVSQAQELYYSAPVFGEQKTEQFECSSDSNYTTLDHFASFYAKSLARFAKAATTPLVPSKDWKVLDIGYANTDARIGKFGGLAEVERINRDFVNALNTAYVRSRMKVFARLVGQKQIAYVETGDIWQDSNNLFASDTTNTGIFAGLRDMWGADILVLTVSYAGGGLGGGPYVVMGGTLASTAVHEFGHSLNLQHDPDSAQSLCAEGDEICLRGHGYKGTLNADDTYGDVMCVGCTERYLRYSHPEIPYNGLVMGEYGVSEGALVAEIVAEEAQNWKPTKSASTCTPDANRVCANAGRFLVQAYWKTPDGREGYADAIPFGQFSALFTFFDPGNLELVVKVLNGCGLNQKQWIFIAAMTNVEVSILVVDTVTGAKREYLNPLNQKFEAIQDTGAFSCD